MNITQDKSQEIMWDDVSISRVNFRPHINGDVINLFSCINPEATIKETESVVIDHVRQIAKWVYANRRDYGNEDRFQIIIGWPSVIRKYDRQIVKIGGNIDSIYKIAVNTASVSFREGWTKEVL